MELGKVLIVGTESSRQLPDALDGIQIRAVGGQKVQRQHLSMFIQKGGQCTGMMVARVVEDDEQATPPCAMAQQHAQNGFEGAGIERRSKVGDQRPVAQIDRAKQGDGLACGGMEQDGIGLLGRHPHHTAGAVLLEVAFIQTPDINAGVAGEAPQFFYRRLVRPGLLGR